MIIIETYNLFRKQLRKHLNIFHSYNICKKLFYKHSKTYYLGSCFFSFIHFKHICALYGFVRVIDDIVDSDMTQQEKTDKFTKMKRDCYFLFKIKNILLDTGLDKKEIIEILTEDCEIWNNKHPIFRAFITTCIYIEIEDTMIERFINSMEKDLTKFVYNTEEELLKYVDGSAMVIGEIMLKNMLHTSIHSEIYKTAFYNKNKEYARTLGYAFQYTNFIRDFDEDRRMTPSRFYLMTENNDTIENKEQFRKFIKKNVDYNWELYEKANLGISNLYDIDFSIGNGISISKILYSGILKKIENNDYDISERRHLTSKEKIKIIKKMLSVWEIITLFINYIIYTYFFRLVFLLF